VSTRSSPTKSGFFYSFPTIRPFCPKSLEKLEKKYPVLKLLSIGFVNEFEKGTKGTVIT
jgi:hypothetical protein